MATKSKTPASNVKTGSAPVMLEAEPEKLELHLDRLALIIVDMQNAFVSKGAMFDIFGYDISGSSKVIKPIKKLASAARKRKVPVIYIAHCLMPGLVDIGPDAPFWYNKALITYRNKPDSRDKLIIRGTWGAEIIDELKPLESDIYIEKPRYSAFRGTKLDTMLRARNIKYLAFTGVATNICVESSLRDAFHLEYFPILISDAASTGSEAAQQVTITNVRECFGWVTTAQKFVNALK